MPYSDFDDSTVPIHQPSWPTPEEQAARRYASQGSAPTAAPRRANLPLGCSIASGFFAAFALGVVVATVIISAFYLTPPQAPTTTYSGSVALSITVTDKLLTEELNANSDGMLANPKLHITSNGHVTVSGTLQGTPYGSGQQAVIVLAPEVASGKISVKAISGAVGGLALPSVLLQPIAQQITSSLGKMSSIPVTGAQSLTVQHIDFTDGTMSIIYA